MLLPDRSKATYDDFIQLSRQDQIKLFNSISAENRAAIVRTHVERWLDQNRARLSDEQIVYVQSMIDLLTAELYENRRREEVFRAFDAMVERGFKFLTRDDFAFAFAPHVKPIPRPSH